MSTTQHKTFLTLIQSMAANPELFAAELLQHIYLKYNVTISSFAPLGSSRSSITETIRGGHLYFTLTFSSCSMRWQGINGQTGVSSLQGCFKKRYQLDWTRELRFKGQSLLDYEATAVKLQHFDQKKSTLSEPWESKAPFVQACMFLSARYPCTISVV